MEDNNQAVKGSTGQAAKEKKEKSAIREIIEAVVIALVITFVTVSYTHLYRFSRGTDRDLDLQDQLSDRALENP